MTSRNGPPQRVIMKSMHSVGRAVLVLALTMTFAFLGFRLNTMFWNAPISDTEMQLTPKDISDIKPRKPSPGEIVRQTPEFTLRHG
jgi:hypothetical protein